MHRHRLLRIPVRRRKRQRCVVTSDHRGAVYVRDLALALIRRGDTDCHIVIACRRISVIRRRRQTDRKRRRDSVLIGVARSRRDVEGALIRQVEVLQRNIRRIHIAEAQICRVVVLTQKNRIGLIPV